MPGDNRLNICRRQGEVTMRKIWDFSFANCLTLDWAYYNPRKYNIYLFVAAVHYTVYSQCTLYSTDRTALNWETVCWGILVSSRCYLESLSETQRGLLWSVQFMVTFDFRFNWRSTLYYSRQGNLLTQYN